MSKRITNQAFDADYDAILPTYFDLQEKAQNCPDTQEAKRAYLANEMPK